MPKVLSWHTEIEIIAGPMQAGDTKESWLARAARKAGISYRQCKALYYREMTDPKHSVACGVIDAADTARKQALALAARFEHIAGGMYARDKDFYGDDIIALVDAARRLRGQDRT